jgi:hypothetical protein
MSCGKSHDSLPRRVDVSEGRIGDKIGKLDEVGVVGLAGHRVINDEPGRSPQSRRAERAARYSGTSRSLRVAFRIIAVSPSS